MLRAHALQIWRAGLAAVRSERLVADALRVSGRRLLVGGESLDLDGVRRIAVVGAGKAGAGMAQAVIAALGPQVMAEKQVAGWVNVPADCVPAAPADEAAPIHLHPARPPGVNEPTPAGAEGAEAILRLVAALGPEDLCLCLISGGGSALLPAPAAGLTLADKLEVTRYLSAAGANIEQLNTVRKQLSRIKGGGLARACRAGRLVALIISDVLGDPLDVIASGPTVPDRGTPADALAVLDAFAARDAGIPLRVFEHLERRVAQGDDDRPPPACRVTNLIIGNNARAVDAAGREAERLGYSPAMLSATASEGPAEEVGRHLAEMALRMRDGADPDCLISGGEPVVRLIAAGERGLGGRNQQLVLAALLRLADDGAAQIALLSGGTDGEDGPTDAAGAVLDADVLAAARRLQLDAADYLRRNDAYRFFQPLGALLRTGPTHTNVCDLRVVVVARRP
jgi:hydroxypyruvate reductase